MPTKKHTPQVSPSPDVPHDNTQNPYAERLHTLAASIRKDWRADFASDNLTPGIGRDLWDVLSKKTVSPALRDMWSSAEAKGNLIRKYCIDAGLVLFDACQEGHFKGMTAKRNAVARCGEIPMPVDYFYFNVAGIFVGHETECLSDGNVLAQELQIIAGILEKERPQTAPTLPIVQAAESHGGGLTQAAAARHYIDRMGYGGLPSNTNQGAAVQKIRRAAENGKIKVSGIGCEKRYDEGSLDKWILDERDRVLDEDTKSVKKKRSAMKPQDKF